MIDSNPETSLHQSGPEMPGLEAIPVSDGLEAAGLRSTSQRRRRLLGRGQPWHDHADDDVHGLVDQA